MTNSHLLKKVDKLRADLESFFPLRSEIEEKILQKIRLEWNFNSVAGNENSLSLDETKALILHGTTKGNKPLKDYIEMKIHNDTISWMFEIATLDFSLTESLIKQIHESILLEPYEVESFTKDGKPILKMIEIGKYKQTPNNSYRQSGKIIEFATPEETPQKMKELIEWFAVESHKEKVNPIVLAAEFHYRFIKIQPFDDANGRIAKILTNLILMRHNYPPIVFKNSDKTLYNFALQQADYDKLDPFIDFIARNLVSSLELYLKGAKGESLEEIDYLEKELIELEQKLRKLSSKIVKREKVVLLDIFDKSVFPLLSRLLENYGKFDRFYIEKNFSITITSLTNLGNNKNLDKKSRTAKTITHLRELLLNEPIELNPAIIIDYNYKSFNRDGFADVTYYNQIVVHFDELEYSITEGNKKEKHSNFVKKYSEELTAIEMEEILNKSATTHKKFIEAKILGVEAAEENLIQL
ncbi:MAG: Fic family protein [Pyrinomonadaceae bacterium]|nr:Fic family protein [Pyrinomonadaceae bacterium]